MVLRLTVLVEAFVSCLFCSLGLGNPRPDNEMYWAYSVVSKGYLRASSWYFLVWLA